MSLLSATEAFSLLRGEPGFLLRQPVAKHQHRRMLKTAEIGVFNGNDVTFVPRY